MDKKFKRQEKPRLRKEDIGTPVNFVHVQHVGFGQKGNPGSISACTSPTSSEMNPFFPQNFRRSDSSVVGIYPGKENRFSNSSQGLLSGHPFSSMSNLSITGQHRDSIGPMNNRTVLSKPPKPSFSGSLLNLNFFPFQRSDKSRNETTRNKRMSLGLQISSPMSFPPPPVPPAPSESSTSRNFMRRRSSSFTGDSNFHNLHSNKEMVEGDNNSKKVPIPPLVRANSTLSAWIKKPKISKDYTQYSQYSQSFDSPPLSPTFDELPPPPEDMIFSSLPSPPALPESPTYSDLPPPPLIIRKESVSSWPKEQSERFSGLIPSPPVFQRKLSAPNSFPDSLPPPLPKSLPPISSYNSTGISNSSSTNASKKLLPLRAKLIRVNAPTLPPLSVPLIKSKNESPNSPQTWPLEPTASDLNNFDETVVYESVNTLPSFQKPYVMEASSTSNSNSKSVDYQHLDPLRKLFQNRVTYKQWPAVMNKLFSKSHNTKNCEKPSVTKVYGELVRATIELWLELEGGTASLEELVIAFEQAEKELKSDLSKM